MPSKACFCVILVVAILMAGGLAAQERKVPDDAVVRLSIKLRTGEVAQGMITRYDEIAFTLTEENSRRHRIPWTTIPAKAVDSYWRFLEQPEGDGEKLFELGQLLISHRDGRELAEQAFAQAVQADASLGDKAQAILDGADPGELFRRVGEGDPAMWGDLDAELMEESTAELRKFSQRAAEELRLPLKLFESDRYMICTDLDEAFVRELGARLAATYRYTAELLGEDPDSNMFRGKCLIFVFSKRVDYLRFQRDLHETDARGTGALCHGFGDGHVHIAAYARSAETETHHVVVHELVHAMLHRYRSPVALPDWLNEGLAMHLAHTVVPPAAGRSLYVEAGLALEGKKSLGDGFFENEHLARWQYPVAGALAEYMFERSDRALVKMLDGIKDGQPWPEAMKASYNIDERRMAVLLRRRLDRAMSDRLGG